MINLIIILIISIYSNFKIDEKKINTQSYRQDFINKLIDSLTLEEKVGQLLIYGFRGTNFNTEAKHLIDKYNLGGLVVFSHNVNNKEELLNLNTSISKYSLDKLKIPAFISVDQEGGKVLRLKNIATILPGNMNIGASNSTALSYLAGKLTAIDLEALGFNINFAPVIDVNTDPDNRVIGVRAFGDKTEDVTRLGTAYIKGIQSRRLSATAKHFPGHGSTSTDSHFSIPSINLSFEELEKYHLKPFKVAINEGVDAIMTAHVSLPKIDNSSTVATLSKPIIDGILRKKLNFEGIIITDDMEMQGILKDKDIGAAAVEAILAGCDIITVVWNNTSKERVFNSLLNAVKNKTISEARLDESLNRILKIKIKRGLFNAPDPDIEKVKITVNNNFHNEIAKLIAKKSITIIKNEGSIPIDLNKRYLVISNFNSFFNELKKTNIKMEKLAIKLRNTKEDKLKIYLSALSYKDIVDGYIITVVNNDQAIIANNIKELTEKNVIVASLDSPYLINRVRSVDAFLCSYSFRPNAIEELINVLVGKKEAQGVLPVTIN